MKIWLVVLVLFGAAFAQESTPNPQLREMVPIFRDLDAIIKAKPIVEAYYGEAAKIQEQLEAQQAQIEEGKALLEQGRQALEEQAVVIAAAEAEVETRYETFVRALQKMFDSLGVDWVVLGGSGLLFAALLVRWTQALKTILRRLFPKMPHKNSELMTYIFLGSSALAVSYGINILGGLVDPAFRDFPPPFNWILFAVYAVIVSLLALGGFSLEMQKAEKSRTVVQGTPAAPVKVPVPNNGQPAPVNPNLPNGGAFPDSL